MTSEKNPKDALKNAIESGIEEANQLDAGDFDGLTGNLPSGASGVLADVIRYLRYYLMKEKNVDDEDYRLLIELQRDDPLYFHLNASTKASHHDQSVWLAVSLLNMIASASKVSDASKREKLIYGDLGVRGLKELQAGKKSAESTHGPLEKRKKRRGEMQAAIDRAAASDPTVSYTELSKRVARKFNCDARTIRRNTKNPHRPN